MPTINRDGRVRPASIPRSGYGQIGPADGETKQGKCRRTGRPPLPTARGGHGQYYGRHERCRLDAWRLLQAARFERRSGGGSLFARVRHMRGQLEKIRPPVRERRKRCPRSGCPLSHSEAARAGVPMVSFNREASVNKANKAFGRSYAEGVEALFGLFANALGRDPNDQESRRRNLVLFESLVGANALCRALGKGGLASDLSSSVRIAYLAPRDDANVRPQHVRSVTYAGPQTIRIKV